MTETASPATDPEPLPSTPDPIAREPEVEDLRERVRKAEKRENAIALWQAKREELNVLRRALCPEATEDQFKFFIIAARHLNLDPFKRQIYLVIYKGRPVLQTGIDGYRSMAARTGEYDGSEPPVFYDAEGKRHEVWLSAEPPTVAEVTVWRRRGSRRIAFVGRARWSAFVRFNRDRPNEMWATMPDHMLAKCAEALALRKAFPDEVGGVYTQEEMAQAENEMQPAHDPEAITAEDRQRALSAWRGSPHRAAAIKWLQERGYEGKGRKEEQVHVRVINDFMGRGKHSQVESLTQVLTTGEPVLDGEVTSFDATELGATESGA